MVINLCIILSPPLGYLIYLHINDYLLIMPRRGLMVVMAVVVMVIWRSLLLRLLTITLKTLLCDSPRRKSRKGLSQSFVF